MTTSEATAIVAGIRVSVVRKDIKHVHLAVYPPDGRVRLAVPVSTSDDVVHAAVATRLPWIRRQQAAFRRQERETSREMVNGETHWVEGVRYRLRVVESRTRPGVRRLAGMLLEVTVRPGATVDERATVLDRWYRLQLREQIPALLDKWVPLVGVPRPDCRIRRMRTRWGSCSARSSRIWLNIELAKKPRNHLEYIVVHELLHLANRHHDAAYQERLDSLMPNWRLRRAELGALPLGDVTWPD